MIFIFFVFKSNAYSISNELTTRYLIRVLHCQNRKFVALNCHVTIFLLCRCFRLGSLFIESCCSLICFILHFIYISWICFCLFRLLPNYFLVCFGKYYTFIWAGEVAADITFLNDYSWPLKVNFSSLVLGLYDWYRNSN